MSTVYTQSEAILDLIDRTYRPGNRIVIGIAGPPGSGKSTLAEEVVCQLNVRAGRNSLAALLPMDGFHLDNEELKRRGLLSSKGAPETFDAAGLVDLIVNVKAHVGDISYPLFDRALDHSLIDVGRLKTETSIVIVEGNYLLLDEPIWDGLAELFDATVFLSPTIGTLERRLVQRWLGFGFRIEDAVAKAHGNDQKNARLVLEHSTRADLTLSEDTRER